MAKIGDLTLRVDKFFTETRIKNCFCTCIHRDVDSMECNLKEIIMNEGGICQNCKMKLNINMENNNE